MGLYFPKKYTPPFFGYNMYNCTFTPYPFPFSIKFKTSKIIKSKQKTPYRAFYPRLFMEMLCVNGQVVLKIENSYKLLWIRITLLYTYVATR